MPSERSSSESPGIFLQDWVTVSAFWHLCFRAWLQISPAEIHIDSKYCHVWCNWKTSMLSIHVTFRGCIPEKNSLDDSSKDVALLFHEDILVDGDRCTVLLRMSGTSQLLTPAEVQRSIKKKLPKFGMASLPSYP